MGPIEHERVRIIFRAGPNLQSMRWGLLFFFFFCPFLSGLLVLIVKGCRIEGYPPNGTSLGPSLVNWVGTPELEVGTLQLQGHRTYIMCMLLYGTPTDTFKVVSQTQRDMLGFGGPWTTYFPFNLLLLLSIYHTLHLDFTLSTREICCSLRAPNHSFNENIVLSFTIQSSVHTLGLMYSVFHSHVHLSHAKPLTSYILNWSKHTKVIQR